MEKTANARQETHTNTTPRRWLAVHETTERTLKAGDIDHEAEECIISSAHVVNRK